MKGALDRHGTRAIVLRPTAIAAAAEADLALRDAKRARRSGRGMPYTFHRRHVRRASCTLDLVDRAIADRYAGVWSNKRVTRLVYGDEETLRAVRMLLSPLADADSPLHAVAPWIEGEPEECDSSAWDRLPPVVRAFALVEILPSEQLCASGNAGQAAVENCARNPRCPQEARP